MCQRSSTFWGKIRNDRVFSVWPHRLFVLKNTRFLPFALPGSNKNNTRTHTHTSRLNACPTRRFLELSDVVCPNETELALLCQADVDPEDQKSVEAGARELIARGM